MTRNNSNHEKNSPSLSPIDARDAFSRLDETEDERFYKQDRFVSHLDAVALDAVESIIGQLIVEPHPVILDLMAGWDSHIPEKIKPAKTVGLGLNENELSKNHRLDDFVIHDVNKKPMLPFPDGLFDIVLNTVSVDYMTHPVEVFREVGRILKPGGLYLVTFSNRMFPEKAVKVWRDADEEGRILLVEELFERSGAFEGPATVVSKGKPRPKNDKYAHLGIPSDPIYTVHAERRGGDPTRKPRPSVKVTYGEKLPPEILEERQKAVKHTMACPYCGERLLKWAVPESPFVQTWDNDFMYVCFNDACPYYVRGWDCMSDQGNRCASYRLMYHPEKDRCMPIPVNSPKALKEGIIQE